MTQTTNNPQYKKNGKPSKGQVEDMKVEEVKVTDHTESESKSDKPSKSNPPTSPKQEVAKGTYQNRFAKEYARINGKELEGAPSIEAANGNPVLVKYYQNYLLNEA